MRCPSLRDFLLGTCVLIAFTSAASTHDATLVEVRVKVALVDADLAVKPVPKQRFVILPEAGGETATITTSFTGEAQIALPPGRYRIQSDAPSLLGGRGYQWNVPFEVRSDAPLAVELSNDNAVVVPGAPPSEARRSDAAEIFREFKDGVVTIESEGAQGSGFLVDERGLVMTNEHVVNGSRYFTVSFDDEHRLTANLVVADATEDVALLLVHPKAIEGRPLIKLAADTPEKATLREGEAVFAIGSPLHQQKIITAGIVSKVETGAIISDVMIDHGNSGGPLLSADRVAVGINTFGEGRGVSGTVRIWKAFPVLEEARKKLNGMNLPSAALLPAIPKTRYPADVMKQMVLAEDFDLEDYHIPTKRFDIFVLTPPALCYFEHQDEIKAAQGRQQRRKKATTVDTYDPVSDIKGWAQYVGEYRALVKIIIVPRIKPTFGSAFAAGMLGSSAVMKYRYQGDVDTLHLTKGGKDVTPLRLGRAPVGQRFAGAGGSMADVAYLGFADFLPEDFAPLASKQERMTLEIINEARDGETVREDLEAEMLQRIWKDFAPLREPASR